MKPPLVNISFALLLMPCLLQAQRRLSESFYVKIKTDSEMYTANLSSVDDSCIWVKDWQGNALKKITVSSIIYIKIKRPVLQTAVADLLTGAGVIVVIDCIIYINYWTRKWEGRDVSGYDMDTPFGKSLLYSVITGGGGGFLFGLTQASFFKVRIPINKNQHLFEKNRIKLTRFLNR